MIAYQRTNTQLSDLMKWLFTLKMPNVYVALLVLAYSIEIIFRFVAYLFALPLRYGWNDVEQPLRKFYLPSTYSTYIEQWWSIFTFMLIPQNFFEFLFVVGILYVFGKIYSEFWYSWPFFILMFFSIMTSAVSYILLNELAVFSSDVSNSYFHGSSSIALALVGFILVFLPQHQFRIMYFLKLHILFVIAIILLLQFIAFSPTPLHLFVYGLSFIAGIIIGAVYKRLQRKLYSYYRKRSKKQRIDDFVKTRTDEEYQEIKKARQEKLDRILEKIARYGYDSLSKEEKDFLFFESKR